MRGKDILQKSFNCVILKSKVKYDIICKTENKLFIVKDISPIKRLAIKKRFTFYPLGDGVYKVGKAVVAEI